MTLTREQHIGKRLPGRVLPLPNTTLGPELYVRELPPMDRNAWDRISCEADGFPVNGDARRFVLVASDENGNRVYTDADAEYFGKEAGHSATVAIALRVAQELNVITEAQVDAAKKNSSATGNGSLPLGSPTS